MKTTRIKVLAGAVGLALANSVSDLQAQPSWPAYYDAPYSGTPTGTMPGRYYATPLSGKVYLNFDLGPAWQQDITMSDTIGDSETVTFDTGARLDFDFGYSFTKNWAAELEVGLIISPVKHSIFLGTDFMDVDLDRTSCDGERHLHAAAGPRTSRLMSAAVWAVSSAITVMNLATRLPATPLLPFREWRASNAPSMSVGRLVSPTNSSAQPNTMSRRVNRDNIGRDHDTLGSGGFDLQILAMKLKERFQMKTPIDPANVLRIFIN